MPVMFVHLRLHSEFSVVDSTLRIDEAVTAAAQDGQPALALTDLNNLFGAVKFYRAAIKAGVQPILAAIDVMAAHCDSYSLAASLTMRTTRASAESVERRVTSTSIAPLPLIVPANTREAASTASGLDRATA